MSKRTKPMYSSCDEYQCPCHTELEELRKRLDTPKARFIRKLAEFLADNTAGKSIELALEGKRPKLAPMTSWAKEWAALYGAASVRGWSTVEEVEKHLTEFLA